MNTGMWEKDPTMQVQMQDGEGSPQVREGSPEGREDWKGSPEGRKGLEGLPEGREVVMSRSSSEPRFEPEPFRTRPKSSSRFGAEPRTGPQVQSSVLKLGGLAEPVWNRFELNRIY